MDNLADNEQLAVDAFRKNRWGPDAKACKNFIAGYRAGVEWAEDECTIRFREYTDCLEFQKFESYK